MVGPTRKKLPPLSEPESKPAPSLGQENLPDLNPADKIEAAWLIPDVKAEEDARQVDADAEDEKTNPRTGWIVGVVALILLAVLVWLYFPMIKVWVGITRTPTPTQPIPTATPRPTRTPTITASPTTAPTATITPYAPSAYSADGRDLQPALPWNPPNILVLDDETAVTPQPPFTDPVWTDSAVVLTQLPGIVINEPYHTTLSQGSAVWQMDAPLKPGMVEIFVSDTTYSSSSSLDFTVHLDGQPLLPLTSRQRVEYWTTRGTPPQVEDLWHSIGIYQINQDGLLSVSASWDARDDFSGPVAIDRVLIVPQPQNNVDILSRLPAAQTRYIVDDTQASITGASFILSVNDQVAWNDSFQKVINTSSDIRVLWQLQDAVPVAVYQAAVFVPEIHGNAVVTYRLLANGEELANADGNKLVSSAQGEWPGGQWVLLGNWEIPRAFEPGVRLSLQMDILADTPGEAAVDAVVFMAAPASAEEN